MTHLDLFSGIGGFALAARWAGLETIQFVEYEPYAQKVLAKNFPGVPIAGDIFEFDATKFLGVGLVTGGFPCQPFSVAGKQLGNKDDRAIWPQMLRVIHEARPTWVIGENVSGIITMELDNVLSDLEAEGYTTQTLVIPAAGVDAKHRRERVWILAHTTGTRRSGGEGRMETDGCDLREEVQTRLGTSEDLASSSEYAPDSNSIRCRDTLERQDQIRLSKCRDKQAEGRSDVAHSISTASRGGASAGETGNKGRGNSRTEPESIQPGNRAARSSNFKSCSQDVANSNSSDDPNQEGSRSEGDPGSESGGANGRSGINWLPEPDVGRVANGVPSRVDRLKGLGNAIVPQVAYEIIRHIKTLTKEENATNGIGTGKF